MNINNRKSVKVGGFSIAQLAAGVFTTAALTVVLLSSAGAKSNTGAVKVMDGAEHYGCADLCFSRYNSCMMAGYGYQYCASQYNQCINSCGGAAARATGETE